MVAASQVAAPAMKALFSQSSASGALGIGAHIRRSASGALSRNLSAQLPDLVDGRR